MNPPVRRSMLIFSPGDAASVRSMVLSDLAGRALGDSAAWTAAPSAPGVASGIDRVGGVGVDWRRAGFGDSYFSAGATDAAGGAAAPFTGAGTTRSAVIGRATS